MSVEQQVETTLGQFRKAVEGKKVADAKKLLKQLKILIITKFNLLPPFTGDEAVVKRQLLLARETLELATMVSVQDKDVAAFERHIAQLKPYYSDYGSMMPASDRRLPMLGLNLLFLLAHNRIADFHTELELIPNSEQSDVYIQYPVELEQHLMEGSYNKVLTARDASPSPNYLFFMDILVDTVREKISDCSEKAYDKFPLKEGKSLLMLKSDKEVKQHCETREWTVNNGTIDFNQDGGENLNIPALRLIQESLSYATELERIV
jgi:26S proteasome regulatory subunit N12